MDLKVGRVESAHMAGSTTARERMALLNRRVYKEAATCVVYLPVLVV